MDHVEQAERIELTDAERKALRVVAGRRGQASWYSVAQVLSPVEYPGQDIDPVRILARLEQAGLIARTPEGGHMHPFTVTAKGTLRLSAETE